MNLQVLERKINLERNVSIIMHINKTTLILKVAFELLDLMKTHLKYQCSKHCRFTKSRATYVAPTATQYICTISIPLHVAYFQNTKHCLIIMATIWRVLSF